MKLMLWSLFVLVALAWTGLVALVVRLSEWAMAGIASGQVAGAVQAAGERLPAGWLQAFLEPAALQALVDGMKVILLWLGGLFPMAGALAGWVSVALWLAWGAGLIALFVASALLHWGLDRWSRHAAAVPRS